MGGAREWGVGPMQDPPGGVAAAMVGGLFGVGGGNEVCAP